MAGIIDYLSSKIDALNKPSEESIQVNKLKEEALNKRALALKLPPAIAHFPLDTLPEQYRPTIEDPEGTDKMRFPIYRAGIKPQNTDPKTGLETLPMRDTSGYGDSGGWKQVNTKDKPYLPMSGLYSRVREMKAAEPLGVTQLPAETIAGMVLKEGSGHMGAQGHDKTQPKQEELYNKLIEHGISEDSARFLTQVTAKKELADRLKMPFGALWNGTGKNWAGQSGTDYVKDLEKQVKAASHPKNKHLMDLIHTAISHGEQYPIKQKDK